MRRHVDSSHPHADYSGYVTWLGQSELPGRFHDEAAGGPDFMPAGRRMLAVYPLIEADESVRRAGWGVMDPTFNSMLREIGALDGTVVRHTPRASDIPEEVYERMARIAEETWEHPWGALVAEAFRAHEVIATPITEYLPNRVVTERTALIGDAAHAQTLMTGAGFREAVSDSCSLKQVFERTDDVPAALEQYELMRLADMQRQVRGSISFSRSFAA